MSQVAKTRNFSVMIFLFRKSPDADSRSRRETTMRETNRKMITLGVIVSAARLGVPISRGNRVPRIAERFLSRQSFSDNAARHFESLFDRRNQFILALKVANRGNSSLRLDQGEIVKYHGPPRIEASQQERVQKSCIRPEGRSDHTAEIFNPSGFRSGQVPMFQNSIAIQLQPRAAILILRLKHVTIAAQLDHIIRRQVAG